MTRVLIAVVAIVSLTSNCFAQVAISPAPLRGEIIHGRFLQVRNLKGILAPLKSHGTFVLAPRQGLIWRIEEPIRTTTIITPAGIRQIINGSEIQRIEASRTPFVSRFYDMLDGALIGDWAAMRHDFAVSAAGDRRAWRTVLTPLRATDPIAGTLSSIVITGAATVESVDINRRNGDSERLVFLDQTISRTPLSAEDARLLTILDINSAR